MGLTIKDYLANLQQLEVIDPNHRRLRWLVSESSPPSVFQTVMRKELQLLREGSFGTISEETIDLRPGMKFEKAKDVLGVI